MFRQANGPEWAFAIRSEGEILRVIAVKGCHLCALEGLIATASKGSTPLLNPTSRWSSYVRKLHGAPHANATITGNHDGPFIGLHARYVLVRNFAAGCKGGPA